MENFVREVKIDGRKIIEEDRMPTNQHTIKRINTGGVLGGEKFIANGIFYKYLKNGQRFLCFALNNAFFFLFFPTKNRWNNCAENVSEAGRQRDDVGIDEDTWS